MIKNSKRAAINKAYYQRQRGNKPPKEAPRSASARMREYRARKKALLNAANASSDSTENSDIIPTVASPEELLEPVEIPQENQLPYPANTIVPYSDFTARENILQELQKQFGDDSFGHVCNICNGLRLERDLKIILERHHELLQRDFPQIDITNFEACQCCLSASNRNQISTYAISNGFEYPDKPAHSPELASISERPISPRIPFMQIRRVRHVSSQREILGQVANVPVNVNPMPCAAEMDHNGTKKEVCIVCEFANKPTVDVGYAEWLTPNLSNENIEEVIRRKSEVLIYWPNCDTASPETMKIRLEENNCTWKEYAIKIIAQGGWAEMCEQVKNCMKYGVTKCANSVSRDIEERESSDDAQESTRDSRKSFFKKRKTKNVVSKETAVIKKNTMESCDRLLNDSSSADEDDEDLQRYSTKDLRSMIGKLKKENKRLQADNTRLEALKSVNDDLPEMRELSSEILRNLRATSVLVGSYSASESQCDRQNDSLENDEVSSELPSTLSAERESCFTERCDIVEDRSSILSERCEEILQTSEVKNEPLSFEEGSPFDDQLSINDNCGRMSPVMSLEDGAKPVTIGDVYHLEETPEEDFVDLGAGCLVDADQLSKCCRKTARKFTYDVLSLVFTREELATSSLTGKVPNTHKKAGISAKKKLDPTKIAAVTAFVIQEFPTTTSKSEVLTAIRSKCNNISNTVRKKRKKS